ncbi:MAG TPA: TonB-dependent receptor [Bacteroidales bacterium]|jgi:iron complex outermembrane receptor protein|nr:TonB-dependent receptor [Bacteroidales bacterium]HOL97109.1 TonB-dependent receptor [Bacteroidales bacterium]HOM37396.1 TonB-dependent receptor [Bacteroidales bacterium]HUM31535.1 TonB-dependent receptor [Bacteroidales bacterium]
MILKTFFFINKVNIIYSYIYQTKLQSSFESKYAIDHLKHKFVLNVNHDLFKFVSGSLDFNIYKRNGEYLPFNFEQNVYLPNAVEFDFVYLLNYRITAQFKNISIFLSVENILNKKFYDIPNVPVPGVTFMSGIKFKI